MTGYRFYETSQLETATKIKAFRQLDLSIEEIKAIFSGADVKAILSEKANILSAQKKEIDVRLSIINHILEDEEHKESDIQIRHSEAVTELGIESDNIKFRKIPETEVLSILHKGNYDAIGQAYAYNMKYAEDNGYEVTGLARECYIDGIWNKGSEEEWLTEIQLPIKG